MRQLPKQPWSDFPALDLVRTGRLVRLAGRATLTFLIFSILGMLFLPWRQTATGTGTVLALNPQERPQPVRSAAEGIVKYVKPDLREGSQVEEGETLLELEPAAEGGILQTDLQVAAVKLQVEAIRSRIDFAEQQVVLQQSSGDFMAESLSLELDAAKQKFEQMQKEEAALEAELVDKRNKLRIAEEVVKQGLVSREELVSKRQAVQIQEQKVLKAKDAVQEADSYLNSKKKEIDSKLEEIQIKNRAAENKRAEENEKLQSKLKELSELEVKRQEMERLTVKAPRSGVIQQWNGLEGSDNIKKGDQLFVIVPHTDQLSVEMMISGNDMPLVHVGDRVRLQFEGWPAVQFVGWPSVAVGTFGGKVNRVFPTDDGKGSFRVLVTPDNHFEREDGWPNDNYLRQGVRSNGWVLLRTVPLGYEIWRQLNGFPPALTADPTKDKGSKVKLPKA